MPDPDNIPMMFRAQINERCKLENVDNKEQRERWLKEWIDPENNGQPYQYIKQQGKKGLEGSIYRIFVKFPYRVLTNSGQDTIIRPIFGKNGIPFIPGSSIKGLFLRVCDNKKKCYKSLNKQEDITQQEYYCGSQKHSAQVRFHGAYPVGNWTGKHNVIQGGNNQTAYAVLDLVHPQQPRQVENQELTSAYPMISLEKPTLMFQFSTTDPNFDWEKFEELFNQSLSQGLGGKTSIGYGFKDNQLPNFIESNQGFSVSLQGEGVPSQNLYSEPEFRPNLFKASLRSHVARLFAGISNHQNLVNQQVEQLFGYTEATGLVKLFWQTSRYTPPRVNRDNPLHKAIYQISGNLYISAPQPQQNLIKKVLQFAYIMGGFGKTWRRVSHHKFYPSYVNKKTAIGCHWHSSDANFISINTPQNLTTFLNNLYRDCQQYLNINNPNFIRNWRESWHPHNVKVYSQVVTESQIIELFHEDRFKFTPAIGGKNTDDDRPKYVSCVWHRMLPINNNQYLEIVTIFNGNENLWKSNKTTFEAEILNKGFTLTWGNNH